VALVTLLSVVLTIILLIFDQILWTSAPANAFLLIVFIGIDLALSMLLLALTYRWLFALIAVWSAFRIATWFAAVLQAPDYGLTYAQFANYLFNPLASTPPNPPAVPGILVDPILVLEVLVLVFALLGVYSFSRYPPYPGQIPLLGYAALPAYAPNPWPVPHATYDGAQLYRYLG
jgi:hypothetical protein